MNRRTFIVTVSASLMSAGVASLQFLGFRPFWRTMDLIPGGAEFALRYMILWEFRYLKLEPEVVDRFLKDYRKYKKPSELVGRQGVFQRFLLSTDFFLNGEDEAKPIQYNAYYDPYITPCNDPISGRGAYGDGPAAERIVRTLLEKPERD